MPRASSLLIAVGVYAPLAIAALALAAGIVA